MKKSLIAFLGISLFVATSLFSRGPVIGNEYPSSEGLDVAEMIINLAPSIAAELNPPAVGAERLVTHATITETSRAITYVIEGEDVNHNGRVLGTYWLTLTRNLQSDNLNSGRIGASLSLDTQELIGAMLNGLYDIQEMGLEHRRVRLDSVVRTNQDPLSFELVGVNEICEHTALNTFLMSITRQVDSRNRPVYETLLTHPYVPGAPPPAPPSVPLKVRHAR